jgi:hypothetical protein
MLHLMTGRFHMLYEAFFPRTQGETARTYLPGRSKAFEKPPALRRSRTLLSAQSIGAVSKRLSPRRAKL